MDRTRHEAGFALIEIIVSAAVLALASLAILAGLDGASGSSGREKARSVAASLAERDQERLRSMQFATLAGYTASPPAPQTVTLDGVGYTVTSTTQWVKDATGGTPSCTAGGTEADYLKISSTVTSSVVGVRTAPVVIDSLVAPAVAFSATHGTLAVQVNDRNGAGLPGIAVSIAGPDSAAAATNASGCALFQYITAGDYTIGLNTPGYVDHWGDQTPQLTQFTVSAGTLSSASFNYDRAAKVTASITTSQPGGTAASAVSLTSAARTVSGTNGTEVGLLRTYPTTPTAGTVSTVAADTLFPFLNAYAFFSGSCGYDNPSYYSSGYWGQTPAPPGQMIADPNTPKAVTVYQPPLNVQLTGVDSNNATIASSGAIQVKATPQKPNGESCVDLAISDLKLIDASSSQKNMVGRATQTVGGTSYLDAGVPYGKYVLCFYDGRQHVTYPDDFSAGAPPYDNTKQYGRATPLALNVASKNTWHGAACP